MAFLAEARAVTQSMASILESRAPGYVGRVLVKEGTDPAQIAQFKSLRRILKSDIRDVLEVSELARCSRVVVLGQSGSGKSYILAHAYVRAVRQFLTSPASPMPFYLDLYRDLYASAAIAEGLERRYNRLFGRVSAEHEPGCILILDALDGRLGVEPKPLDFMNELCGFLNDHSDTMKTVVLACQRGAWESGWLLNSPEQWTVYHTDHLDNDDYAGLIPDPTQRQGFFDTVTELGIQELLALAFNGFDLARRYVKGDELPGNRIVLFQERVKSALNAAAKQGAPPLEICYVLARQLACLSAFAGKPLWTEREAFDYLGESASLRQVCPGVTREDLGAMLRAPLFVKVGERFSFSHELFRDFLAAESLSRLSLRKQRQILESPLPPLQHRVIVPFRGVAGLLSEMAPSFFEHLMGVDPMVAFMADVPGLSSDLEERLLSTVVDRAIAEGRAPWWDIPPRREDFVQFLPRHAPRDIAGFISPYLERPDARALLWAAACAKAWGGSPDLNIRLLELAHDQELPVEIRKDAIDAVLASADSVSIRELYGLLDCPDDQVRGHALQAYRLTEYPTPRDYMSKLQGGSHDRSLLCLLQLDVVQFGHSLNAEQLREAFSELQSESTQIGDLRYYLIQGLLERSMQLGFSDLDPALIIDLLSDQDAYTIYYEDRLAQLLRSNKQLFARVWNCVMDELGKGEHKFYYFDIKRPLAEACDDSIFDLLPSQSDGLTFEQMALISSVLWLHFRRQATAQRLAFFQERAPAFTIGLQIAESSPAATGPDLAGLDQEVDRIITNEQLTAWQKTGEILSVFTRFLHTDHSWYVDPRELLDVLRKLPNPVTDAVIAAFAQCVHELEYTFKEKDGSFSCTHPLYSVPYWVLRQLGVQFSAEKTEQLVRCYMFSGYPYPTQEDLFFPILDELHTQDPHRWTNAVHWLIELSPTTFSKMLEYLRCRTLSVYVERCRQRLENCEFDSGQFLSLLNYWTAIEPSDFRQVLRQCYLCTDMEERNKTRLLYLLLGKDDDWAWSELQGLIDAGRPPEQTPDHSPALPRNALRIPTIMSWYAAVRKGQVGQDHVIGNVRDILERFITEVGDADVIEHLRRLQTENAFPGAEWLGYQIIRVEDRLLSEVDTMSAGQLLDFVNREGFGLVLSERDLFEWACQALEDTQEDIGKRGYQAAGYWNHCCAKEAEVWTPKTETECQNVLWPYLREKLRNLAIVGVEERQIRADRADFWLEQALPNDQSRKVAVELKVARKGYGMQQLVAPLDTQLWKRYMEPFNCRHGIYIVLWFKNPGRYGYPTVWETSEQLLNELNELRDTVSQGHSVDIACYVIDVATEFRLH